MQRDEGLYMEEGDYHNNENDVDLMVATTGHEYGMVYFQKFEQYRIEFKSLCV